MNASKTASAPQPDFDEMFANDTPLIDVRAPIEFEKGAFPTAVNLPILDDDERHRVGICYKESGPEAAQALGYQLVAGARREERIRNWSNLLLRHPNAGLYCFRGGQRSNIACQWLLEKGVTPLRIPGGYRQLRRHLLMQFEKLPPLVIIGGRTGTGKTDFLAPFNQAIDLEGLANHRGSAFGGQLTPQPTQINFENSLAIAFIKSRAQKEVLLEDEGRLIGRIHLPLPLQEKMKTSPLLVIEESLSVRTERIYDEYIVDGWRNFQTAYGNAADKAFEDYFMTAVHAIRKRLGGVAHDTIKGLMLDAIRAHRQGDGLDIHREWISTLLADYYDPMYNYQIEQKSSRIKHRGTREELMDWYNQQETAINDQQ